MSFEYPNIDSKLLTYELKIKKELSKHAINIPHKVSVPKYTDKYRIKQTDNQTYDFLIDEILPAELQTSHLKRNIDDKNSEISNDEEKSTDQTEDEEDENDYNENYFDDDENLDEADDEVIDYEG